MEKKSIFAGKKITLMKPHYKIGPIALDETGTLKNGKGDVLEFWKDYILAEDDHNDNLTRIYSDDNVLLHQFEIKP
jgi:hypothetical protein